MEINVTSAFLPHTDPDASLAFYRDALGFDVLLDVGHGTMRWITVGPAGGQGASIVLYPPSADPGITEAEQQTIAEMMAKGTYASVMLSSPDLDGAFERLAEAGAEIVQEPKDQDYGVRDGAVRDPAGNMIRFQQR